MNIRPTSTGQIAPHFELQSSPSSARAADLERAEPTPAKPSFTARAALHVSGLGRTFHRQYLKPGWAMASNSVKHTIVQAWSDSAANLPSGRATLAAAGQTLQQMVTCAGPTYLREVAFMHAYAALADGMAKKNPKAALALQAVAALVSVTTQVYLRQPRLDRLGDDSNVAVRGHFALSAEQWQALPHARKDSLRQQMHRDSRNVTRNQVIAEGIYLTLGALGAARGDGALSARVLASQVRNVVYAGARDTLQASLSMTATHGDTETYGVNEANMSLLSWAYGAMTLSAGFIQDTVSHNVLPPGQTLTSPALLGADKHPLHGDALASSIQSLAGTRAAFNTLAAILDNHLQKHFDTLQVGATQQWKPGLPLKDYGRLLDQSPARVAWASLASAINMAVGELMKGSMPVLSGFLGNAANAAAMGLAYRTMNQTFQAHASVRNALDAAAPTSS